MRDWNTVVTVREGGFVPACRLLEAYGPVQKSDFFNILVLRAANPLEALAHLHHLLAEDPAVGGWISRFLPLERQFTFQAVAEFEERAREAVLDWLPQLANRPFHVRMHRRGFKGKLSSMDEERFLDEFLLQKLEEGNTPATISFSNPDAIIALESLGCRAGLSLFTREQLARFPLLHLD